MVTRKTGCLIVLASIVLTFAGLVYLAGMFFPYDTTGEGYRVGE